MIPSKVFRSPRFDAAIRILVRTFVVCVIIGTLVMLVLFGKTGHIVAITLAAVIIGAAWLYMESVATPVVKTACPCSNRKPVTTMAGYGPCGCHTDEASKEPGVRPSEFTPKMN